MLLGKAEQYIEVKKHVIFVPSGDLSRLPLGLLPFRGSLFDLQRAVSQVPSLAVLRHLQTRSRLPECTLKISIIARLGNSKAYNTGKDLGKPLPMADIEALIISALIGQNPINAADISREELQTHLASSHILHVATHGTMDTGSPFNSSILIKEPFRVLGMLAVNTEIFLVVFSACLCGTGKASDTGDTLGFAHFVLASGADTFLRALWEADDLATLILMSSFYQILFWHSTFRGESISLAQCWQLAIKSVADCRPDDIAIAEGKKKPERLLRNAGKASYANEFDFSHPYYWAAFCMIGNAGQQIISQVKTRKEEDHLAEKLGAEFTATCDLK